MGVLIQITRTAENSVLINVKTILQTLLSFDVYPKVIDLRVYEKHLIHVSHQVYMFIIKLIFER